MDYSIGPSPDFYAEFRRVTRAAKPDCWTFGEAIDPPDSQLTFEGGMDGSLDFIMLDALRHAFILGDWDGPRLAEFLDRHEAYFPATFSRPSFLDNHDMSRFLWLAKGDTRKLKLAALCQFTLSGAPIIYYGTEIGLSQVRDMRQNGRMIHEEARLPMPWDEQDLDLLEFYSRLCKIRVEETPLRGRTRELLQAKGPLLVYRRRDPNGSLVCVLNLSDQPVDVVLEGPESALVHTTSPECRISPESGAKRIHLPAYGGALLK